MDGLYPVYYHRFFLLLFLWLSVRGSAVREMAGTAVEEEEIGRQESGLSHPRPDPDTKCFISWAVSRVAGKDMYKGICIKNLHVY